MAKSTAMMTDNETGKSFEMPIIHGTIGYFGNAAAICAPDAAKYRH